MSYRESLDRADFPALRRIRAARSGINAREVGRAMNINRICTRSTCSRH